MGKLNKTIIITGCARSGTHYIAKVLAAVGLNIQHEAFRGDGVVAWPLVPLLRESNNTLIFHQVRHPLDVIGSCETLRAESWDYIARYVSLPNRQNTFECGMKYWWVWTKMADHIAHYTYRIENLYKEWPEITYRIGINPIKLPEISPNTNSRQHTKVTWEMLYEINSDLAEAVKQQARWYGYER